MLNEKYLNLHNPEEKLQYAAQVYKMLQKSYEPIGGLKGNGFNSIDDMIKNIPFWKLYFHDGELECIICYKDKNGRKMVALAVSGTPKSKSELKNILTKEFSRSYFEVSGPLLKFLVKTFGESFLLSWVIKQKGKGEPSKIYCETYPKLCPFFYSGIFGNGEKITKLMLGTMGKMLTFNEWVKGGG